MSADADGNLDGMERVWMLESGGPDKAEKIRHEVGFRCFKCEEKYPSAFLAGARKPHLSPAPGFDAISTGRLAFPMKKSARAAGNEPPAVAVARILQTLGPTGR